MLIGSNHAVKNARELDAVLDDKVSKQSEHFIYLGVNIDNRLNWNNHVSCVSSKVYTKLKIIIIFIFFYLFFLHLLHCLQNTLLKLLTILLTFHCTTLIRDTVCKIRYLSYLHY